MTDVATGADTPALRRYGAWHEDGYTYSQTAERALAIKRFRWTSPAIAVATGQVVTLDYYADAAVDPKRLNELAYLAEHEQRAMDELEAMVLAAINGRGYLGVPHVGTEMTKAVTALVGQWIDQRGHPPTWYQDLERVIHEAATKLFAWQAMLRAVQAAPDPEHPRWGLVLAIVPLEPREG